VLTFALDKLNVRHISTSGLVHLPTYKVCHVMHTSRWKFPPSLKLIRYSGIERWRKSFTTIVLGDHDFLLIASFFAIW